MNAKEYFASIKAARHTAPAEAASDGPRTRETVLAEIARILKVPEGDAGWGRDVLQLRGLKPNPDEEASLELLVRRAFRVVARRVHPDGHSTLSREEEGRCGEALTKLRRARDYVLKLLDASRQRRQRGDMRRTHLMPNEQ
eukprot:CAMPEP_0179220214 /NCGR_PEP_ID=MMETSP0797-20121207/5481_1 /TAXON_ID=47934 /ORGANISM="Dinophysis acuminata, Strain DAEP01" /LENGTH=140 /DNA_ID=CAMNT_0020926801 /DNA_START=78 /DNA_END=500 /DNA_ORIENTATION=+